MRQQKAAEQKIPTLAKERNQSAGSAIKEASQFGDSPRYLLSHALKEWTRHTFVAPIPPNITTVFLMNYRPLSIAASAAQRIVVLAPLLGQPTVRIPTNKSIEK